MKTCSRCGGAMPDGTADGLCANGTGEPPVIGESPRLVSEWRYAIDSLKRHPVLASLVVGLILVAVTVE